MKPVMSGPSPAITLGQAVTRLPRRWPIATVSVLAVTVVVTVLQFPFPAVRLALWRDPAALAAGQWWRLVTALFVQYDPWWQIVIVFALIAGIGAIAERLFGPGRWLLLYVGCGVVGQAFGFRWQPYDAGASVAGAGLLGAVCAWLLWPAGPPLARARIWGWPGHWPAWSSPRWATSTAHPCCWASPWGRCCCGATGGGIRAARDPDVIAH
jgi:membrane associated rhomboid family serine protease